MPNAGNRAPAHNGAAPQSKAIDLYLAIPLAGVIFALILQPLLISGCAPTDAECLNASRPENKIVWPLLALCAFAVVGRNWRRVVIPSHIGWLLGFLAFAGASVAWAFRPELSGIRYLQQVMIVSATVLPALILTGRGDLLRGLFLCFALACVLNVFMVLGPPPVLDANATPGHTGYFSGKNYLAICAAVALLLSFHEIAYTGLRRWMGVAVAGIALVLLVLSNGKTAMGLTLIAPVLATAAFVLRRTLRLSTLAVPFAILAAYAVLSTVLGFDVYKLSYYAYGDSTFTGRRWIWIFANEQIAERPFLGWGYQSFWLVGPDAPSVVKAPGWVKTMPNAHNGYLDTILEMGYLGFFLLVTFVATTLHAAGRLVDRDPARGWAVLTLAFFIIITNGLESMWMRAFEFLWLVFLILAAEVARARETEPVIATQPVSAPMFPVKTHKRVSALRPALSASDRTTRTRPATR
ncbi:MAG: O-antigen ligase family protein [Hyphomicrobiaceae bacterium]|nr:O-antigen ligase family protein [Hyphomicrobiaceae bacterium]